MLEIVRRPVPSTPALWLGPLAAIALTVATAALTFEALGYSGAEAVWQMFLRPVLDPGVREDLLLEAAPLVLIGTGLALGFRAGVFNIGAEGQFVLGGLGATAVALASWGMAGPWILPLMVAAGTASGLAWALIPAALRTRLGVSEILTSLMLTYVSVQLLGYLVRGPWRDPEGFNFPETRLFDADRLLPTLGAGFLHWGVPAAFAVAALAWLVLSRTVFGFRLRTAGAAPRAAVHAGFTQAGTVWAAMGVSGACAGLAGALEAAGPYGQMVPQFPSGLGFTAIIVAFLGRLHPGGVVPAALVMATTAVGGEMAQSALGVPAAAAGLFQATALFFLLAADVGVRYRLRLREARA